MITVQAIGFEALQQGLLNAQAYLATGKTEQLIELGHELQKLVADEISGHDFMYTESLYKSIGTQVLDADSVAVTHDEEGNFILYGTPPSPDSPHSPRKLQDWVRYKLGIEEKFVFATARAIFRHGIVASPRKYPAGARGYNYAERVVEDTGRDTIQNYAERIGDMAIRYLDTG